mmetsp:Transcript_76072/g.111403  ORF Transcript_76072/g.111403 Transcript_76072/m.111403 type:complete len:254 (+) Transcript_76072:546-1307(+)
MGALFFELACSKKEIAKMKIRVSKDLKGEQGARKEQAKDRFRLVRDSGRLSQQTNNVGKLLQEANTFANEAESSLKKSQILRLNSESSIHDGTTVTAASDFKEAGHEKRKSSTMTRKALDYRSRARLGQEYVLMLTHIVQKDKTDATSHRHAVSAAKQTFDTKYNQLRSLEKKKSEIKTSVVEEGEVAMKSAQTKSHMELEQRRKEEAAQTRQAKREEQRAMRLIHMSHKLQGKAAELLDASTKDIEIEENLS